MPLMPIDALIEQLKGPKPFDATSAIRLYEALKRLSDYLLKFGAIEGRQLATDAVIAAINEGNQGWSTNIVFSATDFNTVAWTAGVLRFQDGSRANIVAGNTGNISALTYIYYDGSISQTALLVTSDSAKIVGDRRRLVAVAEDSAAGQEAYFLPLSGKLGINEDNIGDNSISTDKIQASSIVAGKIAADAVTADKILAGSITASKIAANTITANEIAANAITADEIAANAVTAAKILAGAIDGFLITGATIRTSASNPRLELSGSTFIGTDSGGNIALQFTSGAGGFDTIQATFFMPSGQDMFVGTTGGGQIQLQDSTNRLNFNIAGNIRGQMDDSPSSTQTAWLLYGDGSLRRVSIDNSDLGSGAKRYLYLA